MSAWRYALASVIGTAHLSRGVPCQDAAACIVLDLLDGQSVLVTAVADGAGSAEHARTGAEMACALFIDRITSFYAMDSDFNALSREFFAGWLGDFQEEVGAKAAEIGASTRDFASTLLGAIIEPEKAVFFQIGDGAIVVSRHDEPDEYSWMFWPQNGEYANVTYFATDPSAQAHFEFATIVGCLGELAIFTDGLQSLALHSQTRTAHAPLFRAVLSPLRAEPDGRSESLCGALTAFLESERVNERTDDDKTLLLATRRKSLPDKAGDSQVELQP